MDKKNVLFISVNRQWDALAAQEMQVSAEKRQALPNYRMS